MKRREMQKEKKELNENNAASNMKRNVSEIQEELDNLVIWKHPLRVTYYFFLELNFQATNLISQ